MSTLKRLFGYKDYYDQVDYSINDKKMYDGNLIRKKCNTEQDKLIKSNRINLDNKLSLDIRNINNLYFLDCTSGKLLKYFIRIELKNYNKYKKINKKIIDEQKKNNKEDKINELKQQYLKIVIKENNIYKLDIIYLKDITEKIIRLLELIKNKINTINGIISYEKMKNIIQETINENTDITNVNIQNLLPPDLNDASVKNVATVMSETNIEEPVKNRGVSQLHGNLKFSSCLVGTLIGSALIAGAVIALISSLGASILISIFMIIIGIVIISASCDNKNHYDITTYFNNIINIYKKFIEDLQSYNMNKDILDTCVYNHDKLCEIDKSTKKILKKILSQMDTIFEDKRIFKET